MNKALSLLCLLPGIFAWTIATAADQTIRLNECQITQNDLHALALRALDNRGYNIEQDTPTLIVGEQQELKVEILIEPENSMVIRWMEGFGHRRDLWLRNLKTDILWYLAE
jgi:hypothetical protein